MPRSEQALNSAPTQIHTEVFTDGAIRIGQPGLMIEDVGLLARPSCGIGNFSIKFQHLRAKLVVAPLNTEMPININAALAKICITSDMIEMPFRVKHEQPIRRTSNRCVSMNSRGSRRVSARINNKRGLIASNETSVHSPRRKIAEARNSETSRGKEHRKELRSQNSEFRIPRFQKRTSDAPSIGILNSDF